MLILAASQLHLASRNSQLECCQLLLGSIVEKDASQSAAKSKKKGKETPPPHLALLSPAPHSPARLILTATRCRSNHR